MASKTNNYIIKHKKERKVKQCKVFSQTQKEKYCECGIYKIKCNNCESICIGKTNRPFQTRFAEHIRAYKNRNSKIFNVGEHLITEGHAITDIEHNHIIIEINRNKTEAAQLEKYYIYKYRRKHKMMSAQ